MFSGYHQVFHTGIWVLLPVCLQQIIPDQIIYINYHNHSPVPVYLSTN